MIEVAQPIPVGNAVKVLFAPASTTILTRVLRKLVDTWTDQDDTSAAKVYEGEDSYFVDTASLTNGTPYYYKTFEFDGTSWTTSPSVSVTPLANLLTVGPDPLSVVRDRLEAGLRVEVLAGRIQHDFGYVPVLTAPPMFDSTRFPLVTVHLKDDSPAERGLGEIVDPQEFSIPDGLWSDAEGWLSSVDLTIMVWVTANADVRIAMRRAVKKVLMGNLPVFEDAGMIRVTFSASDMEDFQSYEAPIYQTAFNFNCLAPSNVVGTDDPISDVTVTGVAYHDV